MKKLDKFLFKNNHYNLYLWMIMLLYAAIAIGYGLHEDVDCGRLTNFEPRALSSPVYDGRR